MSAPCRHSCCLVSARASCARRSLTTLLEFGIAAIIGVAIVRGFAGAAVLTALRTHRGVAALLVVGLAVAWCHQRRRCRTCPGARDDVASAADASSNASSDTPPVRDTETSSGMVK